MQRPVTEVERNREFCGPSQESCTCPPRSVGPSPSASRLPGARARHAERIDGDKLYLHGACDAGNDLVLHLQQIGAIGIELIGP